MRPDAIEIDESGAGCEVCGVGSNAWGHAIPIAPAAVAILSEPELIETMPISECRRCGAARDWDVVQAQEATNGAAAASRAARRATVTAFRLHLALGSRPAVAADAIRNELGVVGIVVAGGTELARRLGFA